jgi:hypothetical protein
MAQVKIKTVLADVEFPAGTLLGQYRFRLFTPTGLPYATVYVDPPLPAEVVFPNVAAGEYTLNIVRLTTQSIPIGSAYTAPVSVPVPAPVIGSVVTGATVTIA